MLRRACAWRLRPSRGLSLARAWSNEGPRPVPLSYTQFDGPTQEAPLVFLHGLFGSKTNFQSIAKSLARQTGRKVLTVDARNHGESTHSSEMSYEAMSADLQALLSQLGLPRCVLIGHSMGGKTAMTLALQKPELVERLVSVDISPEETTGVSDFPSFVAAMQAVRIPKELTRSQARKLADEQLKPVIQEVSVRQFLVTNLVEAAGRYVWRVNLEALTHHMDALMGFPQLPGTYSGPTLFLGGSNSQFIRPSHHPKIRRLFPQAQILSVPGAGHWVHADQPHDFTAAVRDFLT
ncbi:protein ABHD11 [Ornithorhynchus anatinus]|uniref:protein ABHD11 n=1 Tax=Ornithorhynchus anatinus TaxID=9258 RepID=UPI0010A850F5|nr:protein ABHD11 [Ornithorhynchus anatinus]